jgi:DNA-binding response OmpR family regulator
METPMPKIMLVEDDATMVSLLQTLLQMEGYQVVKMKEETLENISSIVRQEQPDLALVDVHLKELNGFDVLSALIKERGPASMGVVMSSGMECRSQCLENGADDFILKPYMPDDLIAVIQNTLQAKEQETRLRENRG